MGALDLEKSIERIGLADVLMSLCPGAVIIGSVMLWLPFIDASTHQLLFSSLSSTAFSFMLLLIAYAVGLVVRGWSAQGFVSFATVYSLGWRSCAGLNRLWWPFRVILLAAFHGRPLLFSSESDLDNRLQIADVIRERYGESVFGELDHDNIFYIFRVLSAPINVPDQVIANEADAVYRRRGFAQGVALAVVLVALSIGVELALARWSSTVNLRDTIWFSVLLAIGTSCCVASVLLRLEASRLHLEERIFTYALLQSARNTSRPKTVSDSRSTREAPSYAV